MNDIFLQIILYIYNTVGFHNLGVTIIVLAVASRVIFYPFLKQQMHQSRKMNEIQPKLSALKAKHKDNKQAMAQAQMDLFKEHGINPAAGCLPSIVQIVVLFALLGAMNTILTMKLNTQFFIWNMAKPDAYKIASIPFAIPGILVFIASLTQFIQMKMMMPMAPKVRKEDKPQEKEEKQDFMASFAEAQGSTMTLFPLIFLFLGTQWPSGLALYWSVSSILSIAQQYKVSGLGGLAPLVVKLQSFTKGRK